MERGFKIENLKHKILQCNDEMISLYLEGRFRKMDLKRILLNHLIDEAIKEKQYERGNKTK